MEKENEIIEQAEEIITEMCLDAANAAEEEQPDEDYGEQIMRLTAQVEALEAENRQLRQSIANYFQHQPYLTDFNAENSLKYNAGFGCRSRKNNYFFKKKGKHYGKHNGIRKGFSERA